MSKRILSTAFSAGLLGLALLFSSAAPAQQSVNLSPVANIYGIGTLGVAVTIPNLDGSGSGAYATNLLGTSRSFGGASFNFLAPGAKSAVTKAVVPLPAGKFTALKFLGAGSGANQLNQPFIVTYTDGTTKTFTQNLSNYGGTPQNYPNETVVLTMPYKISTTGVQHNGSYHVLGYSFALDSTKTVKSFTLPNTSGVFAIAMNLTPAAASTTTKVSLSSVDNIYGIGTLGVPVTVPNLDGSGSGAYATNLLGTSLSFGGASFSFAAPGPKSAVTKAVVPLPAGKFTALKFLGAGSGANQLNQPFIVTYTDGTTKTFTQNLSNYGGTPQNYPNETVVLTMPYKISTTGVQHNGSYHVLGYTFALDGTKTVKSFTLPNTSGVFVIALDVIASGAPSAATPAFNPLPGTFTTGPTVNLSDTTPGASIFFTTNGTTPTTSSTKYTVPFKITATNGVETVEAMAVASGFSNSPVVIAAYTVNPSATPTATPTFSPTPGTFTFGPSVSLSDTTSGASIFFTTDGSTPTAASTKYASAFKLSKTSTVKAIAIASGHTISAVASATYTVTTPAPSALSYSVPPPLLIGKSVSLSPTVTGTVTAYSVSPGLPTGLALNTATGVISGKPTTVTAEASYTITASNGSGSTTFVLALKVDLGPTVHLTATATTSMGTAPTFTWKTTDGVLLNTNGAQTDWLLPPGFGLHFAYVMVADGRGGFREGRLVVNTDSFGAPPVIPVASLPRSVAASAYRPPAAAAAPNVAKHSVLLGADNGSVTPGVASTTLNVDGSVQLADHNLPGATDPFFGLNVAATVALTTPTCITNADCPSVESTRPFGEFAFSAADPGPVGTTVTVTAQSQNSNSASTAFTLTQTDLSLGLLLPPLLIPGSAAPTISAMSATFNSVSVGIFQLVWPTPAAQPSDGYPQQNWFLSFKGDDTRLSACQYYLAVGAVSTCDSSGKFTGGINFTDWRKQVQIDSFAPGGAVTTTATYVNVVDLNLTRSHHSIVYPGGQVGTYVCNSLGPVDSSGKPITVNLPASSMTAAQQTAVNAAVTNAINGKNLVACVAMDYISTPINGFAQFTRFLVFGPDGELLPSVNLDGRGEKFLPGACVACHGGDSYSGKFPENGTGAPDIGAHFLPYDTGNFAFSTQAGLTQAAQEAAIYQLNQNITGTNPTPNTSNLIAGWYQAGHVLDQNYVPTEWASYPDLYRTVVARSCRTCHAALPKFDWDASGPNGFQTTALQVCDGGGLDAVGLTGTQAMPNSKVTFDRLWDSAGTSEDQPAKLTAFYQSRGFMGSTSTCILRKALH